MLFSYKKLLITYFKAKKFIGSVKKDLGIGFHNFRDFKFFTFFELTDFMLPRKLRILKL